MKKEREKTLEAKLKKSVERDLNGLCLKLSAQHLSGLPDRLCLLPNGRLFFAELKTTGEKPRKLQLSVHRQLQERGFDVHVLDTTEKIDDLLGHYRILKK